MGNWESLRGCLVGALVGLARATDGTLMTAGTDQVILAGLALYHDGMGASEEDLQSMIQSIRQEKFRLVPNCVLCAFPCGRTSDYDVGVLLREPEEVRLLKERILGGLGRLAELAVSQNHGGQGRPLDGVFYRALFAVGEDWGADLLGPVMEEVERSAINSVAARQAGEDFPA